MKQYGLRLTRQDKSTIKIYYNSLSYIDWVMYTSTEERTDPSTIRYIISNYVVRFVDGEEDKETILIMDESVSILNTTIESIYNKSLFNEEDKYIELMAELEKRSRTLIGTYDLFIFLKMGPDFYINMLSQDSYTRALILSMIEKSTGIKVKERFTYAVENNIPLDIISDNEAYAKDLRKNGKPVPKPQTSAAPPMEAHNKTMSTLDNMKQDKRAPSNVEAMLADSRNELSRALTEGRTQKKTVKPFNWNKDESNFNDSPGG